MINVGENIKLIYVIDCNVIVKWFIPEKDSEIITKLLEKATNKEINLYSTTIVVIEFANVLARYYRKSLLTESECIRSFTTLIKMIKEKTINIISLNSEQIGVLSLALESKISYYDAEYLYLSKKLNADLITYDKHLSKIVDR